MADSDPTKKSDVGSNTDAAVAPDDVVDSLPEDLDVELAGPITFPNNDRRRIPAVLYLLMGGGALALAALHHGSPFVNNGLLGAGAVLVVLAVYGFVAGRSMKIDESEALVAANQVVDFPIGHASAQQSWRGLLSRPIWRLLVYSAENPPKRRGLVLVDAVDGRVIEQFDEPNPETWTE
jgi:hypothetical protein